MASRGSMKARRPALLKRKCSPASPARTNSALEAVSKQRAAPKQARWSAKSWYCSGCGMRGSSVKVRPATTAASSHRPRAFLSGRRNIEEFSVDGGIACDSRGRLHRIAINAGADARERDGLRAVIDGKSQRVAVAGSQQFRFIVIAAAPDRA